MAQKVQVTDALLRLLQYLFYINYVSSALTAKTSFTIDSHIITSVSYPEREKSLSRLISNLQTLMILLLNMTSVVLC